MTSAPDSRASWFRLALSLVASTLGGVGMWSVVVALPAVQGELGAARAEASLAYTMTMIGFALGGVVMGGLADRFGVAMTTALGGAPLGPRYGAAGHAAGLTAFALAHGLLIGLGTSATFAPLVADVSHWFLRRRRAAGALCASGNYLAGTFCAPVMQHFIESAGWRQAHINVGLLCAAPTLPLALTLRRPSPHPPSLRPAGATGGPA